MSDGYPSMTALLGLLALAGYQNRDKIAEMLRGDERAVPDQAGTRPGGGGAGQAPGPAGAGGLLGEIGKALGSAGAGGFLGGGIGQLVEQFRRNGHGEAADSWVRQGPNRDMSSHELGQALGPDLVAAIAQRTGLSQDELLSRLSRALPGAIDQYTPDGRVPAR